MVETPSTWWIENESRRDELTNQVSSTLLKLFFRKQIEKSGESAEKSEQEININVQWSIKWPDSFWNYVLSFDGKKILLDENLNDVTWLEFVGITPYNDRYYVCDMWGQCVFFDTQTWKVIEFAEFWREVRAKIYWTDELCDDEFMEDLCRKSIILYPNENREGLILKFQTFLYKYYQNILWKDIDLNSKLKETSEFGKECKNILIFLMWAYEYMYNREITNYLSWKDSNTWRKLRESEILKEMYPDLYLAMRELDFLKNVLLNTKWEICGYITIKDWKCRYIQTDWTMSEYDDFIWPDIYGNIITQKWSKKYFINSNFQYPFFWFDDIIWPDKNGIYILKAKNKRCLVWSVTWKLFSLSEWPTHWNEPDYIAECFDSIQWPDKNNNYIVKRTKWYFLVNKEWEKISDTYIYLSFIPETWNYKTLSMSWNSILDKDGKVIK